MKSRIGFSSFVLALGLTATAAAQSPTMPDRWSVGILGGPDVSNYDAPNGSQFDERLAPMGGVYLDYKVDRHFGVRPELLYWQRGAKILTPNGTNTQMLADGSDRISYLELPVLARVQWAAHRAISPYLTAGPAISLRIGCTAYRGISASSEKEACTSVPENFRRTDLGVVGGAGLAFHEVSLGVLYHYGFEKLASNLDLKNRSLAFTAGLSIKSW
jgi:hypothetical protein